MKHLIALFLLAVTLAAWVMGCTQPAQPTPMPVPATATEPASPTPIPATLTPSSPFSYDASIPFDVKVNSKTQDGSVTVVDLSYAAHDPTFSPTTGGRTVAYLVQPTGDVPFAGVIYMHWLGTYVTSISSRSQYLEEAVMLAHRGVVCLLPQGYYPWMALPRADQTDRQLIIGQTIELRRAIDFLLAQPGVDPNRLGYVGHNYGALYGGILSGVDHRVKTYVLIAGTGSFADWTPFLGGLDAYKRENYLPLVRDLDPIQYVSSAAPASLFFQFAEKDSRVPQEAADSFYTAASAPKRVEWYADLQPDVHELLGEKVRQARLRYLAEQLNLKP
jgi:dienelactone hydrolase